MIPYLWDISVSRHDNPALQLIPLAENLLRFSDALETLSSEALYPLLRHEVPLKAILGSTFACETRRKQYLRQTSHQRTPHGKTDQDNSREGFSGRVKRLPPSQTMYTRSVAARLDICIPFTRKRRLEVAVAAGVTILERSHNTQSQARQEATTQLPNRSPHCRISRATKTCHCYYAIAFNRDMPTRDIPRPDLSSSASLSRMVPLASSSFARNTSVCDLLSRLSSLSADTVDASSRSSCLASTLWLDGCFVSQEYHETRFQHCRYGMWHDSKPSFGLLLVALRSAWFEILSNCFFLSDRFTFVANLASSTSFEKSACDCFVSISSIVRHRYHCTTHSQLYLKMYMVPSTWSSWFTSIF